MPPISDSQRAARIKAVQEHFHIENTHDLDAVMDTFGTTCSFLANNELHEGREAVRAFYGEFFRGFPDLRFDIKSLHAGDEADTGLLADPRDLLQRGQGHGAPPQDAWIAYQVRSPARPGHGRRGPVRRKLGEHPDAQSRLGEHDRGRQAGHAGPDNERLD